MDLNDLLDDMDEVLGDNATASPIRGYLNTGIPELNKVLTGRHDRGFAMGRVVEVFGGESSGKTFIATLAMISAQAQGGIAFFADHERSFSPSFAESLGLDLSPSKFRHFKPKTVEDSVDALVSVAMKVREKLPIEIPCLWVIDSIASMIPAEVLYKRDGKGKRTEELRDTDTYNMRDNMALASATSKTFKVLKLIAEDYNFTVIMLNQLRIDPTVMFGNPEKTPGGKTPAFVADTRVSLGKKAIKDSDKNVCGFTVKAKTIKNKIYRPELEAEFCVMYTDTGAAVDIEKTLVDYAVRSGLIEKNGTRVEWKGKKMFETQLVAWFKTKPEDFDELNVMINAVDSAEE